MNKEKNNYILMTLYSIIIILGMYLRSELPYSFSIEVIRIAFTVILFITSVLLTTHSLQEWVWIIFSGLITLVGIITRHVSYEYLLLVLLLFSLSRISPKFFVKTSITIVSIFLLFLFFLTIIKVLPNITLYRDGAIRQSLGTRYPLILSAYILYICSGYLIITKKNNPIAITIILVIIVIVLDKITNARNDELTILSLVFVVWIDKFKTVLKTMFINIFTIIVLSFIFFSVFITKLIPYTSNFYNYLDVLFSGRLGLQYKLFDFYTPKLIGQNIIENGLNAYNTRYYFYIDNSYVKLLFFGGIFLFFLLLIVIFYKILQLNKYGLWKISLILLLLLINGITEDSFIRPSINFLIPIYFINIMEFVNDFGRKDGELLNEKSL